MDETKNEYKRLTILIVFSIIFGIIFTITCLIDLKSIILFSLSFGLASDLYFLKMIRESLKSKDKWTVILDFNYYHEGFFELIFFTVIIGIEFLAIIIAFIVIV